MLKFFCICVVMLSVIGCSSIDRIRIGGAYEGIEGNIDLYFDKDMSSELQKLVLKSSDGTIYLGITREDAEIINTVAEDSFETTKGARIAIKETPKEDQFKRLIEFLKKQK